MSNIVDSKGRRYPFLLPPSATAKEDGTQRPTDDLRDSLDLLTRVIQRNAYRTLKRNFPGLVDGLSQLHENGAPLEGVTQYAKQMAGTHVLLASTIESAARYIWAGKPDEEPEPTTETETEAETEEEEQEQVTETEG